MTTPATTPADGIEQSTIMGNLRRFLDVAAGEGYVFDGIDAADLYIAFFGDGVTPPASVLALATPSPGKAEADGIKEEWFAGRNVWGSDLEHWLAFIERYEYAPTQLVEWLRAAIK